jgi:hypothetical protein
LVRKEERDEKGGVRKEHPKKRGNKEGSRENERLDVGRNNRRG